MRLKMVCLFAACTAVLLAQTPRVAFLEIEIENQVYYWFDVPDATKLAASAGPVANIPIRGFLGFISIADIVSVNGKPAKGLWENRGERLSPSASPAPTMAAANVTSGNHVYCAADLFTADGTWVGKLTDGGLVGSLGPTHPILGGAGAFLGVVGEHGWVQTITAARNASAAEDPSQRQILGGGRLRIRYYLVPKQWPQVEETADGPSVFHGADWSLVTAAKPARAGEVLVVRAKGLGPTRPDLLPAGFRPFPDNPVEVVNSPVEVNIGGREAEVVNKVGWPGSYDLYRVDFRVPPSVTPGMATLRLTAAWISGPEVKIPVQ